MRIPNKVVCLWSCLTAFTFIHTAAAQDYPAEPLGGRAGVASADYYGTAAPEMVYGDSYGDGQSFAPLAYDAGLADSAYPDAVADPAYYPPPLVQGPVVPGPGLVPAPPPNASYWPNISPFDTRVMDRTYRQNGIWVNDSMYGSRQYLFSVEYLRTWFFRPGSDLIGAPGIGVPSTLPGSYQVNTTVFGNGNDLPSDGIRGKFIIQNADKTTMEMSGFWVAEGSSTYEPLGRGDPTDFSTLAPRGFLGLSNGTKQGVQVPFDTDFKLGYKEQAFGFDLTWSLLPVYESNGFRLKPLIGAKYLKVREQFTLHGEDSALVYTVDPVTFLPDPTSVAPNPNGNPAFSSDLTSRTKSDIAGPEAGIRYEIGGRNFTVWGQSRLAVAANHEVIELYGNQIGDGFVTGFPQPTLSNPKPAAFRDGQSHTHVSPVFSQDFYFKGKVFKAIPYLKDSPLLGNADLLVGYNFILVGNMARPTKVIDWRVNDPRIDLTHSRWLMQAATVGLQWAW